MPTVGLTGRHNLLDLPAAGHFRERAYGPRELLSRTGSLAFSPPQHPHAEHFFKTVPADRNPRGQHTMMHLSRCATDPQMVATRALNTDPFMRPAGVGGFLQTAKTRGEFKANQIHGQFSTEEVNGMPMHKKVFQPLRSDTGISQGHQKSTSALRRTLEQSGHLPLPRMSGTR